MPKELAERDYRKPCTLCEKPRDVLVRCQIDETGLWHFVCPGACWTRVSGGKVDGNGDNDSYRYGGMWKNKHEAVSAKKPKRSKKSVAKSTDASHSTEETASEDEHVTDDKLPPPGAVPANEVDMVEQWNSNGKDYTRNDRVRWDDETWVCRKGHKSDNHWTPAKAYSLWKTAD